NVLDPMTFPEPSRIAEGGEPRVGGNPRAREDDDRIVGRLVHVPVSRPVSLASRPLSNRSPMASSLLSCRTLPPPHGAAVPWRAVPGSEERDPDPPSGRERGCEAMSGSLM